MMDTLHGYETKACVAQIHGTIEEDEMQQLAQNSGGRELYLHFTRDTTRKNALRRKMFAGK